MLLIVAHHYVVNSGLQDLMLQNSLSAKSMFLYFFGAWGKMGINGFVLITGYFMCKSQITLRKYLKLLLQIYFYNISISLIFVFFGYSRLDLLSVYRILFPMSIVRNDFIECFLWFFLFIPFLNILVRNMNKKQHALLSVLCLIVYIVVDILPPHVAFNYVTWFSILFILASYIRFYGLFPKLTTGHWGFLALFFVACSCLFMFLMVYIGKAKLVYCFNSECNRIFAVLVAICSFMYFKDIKVKQSKFINTVSASTFGVLLIHSNCNAMRQWLWKDTLDNIGQFALGLPQVAIHAVVSVLLFFSLSTLIDHLRIRFLEPRCLAMVDKMLSLPFFVRHHIR